MRRLVFSFVTLGILAVFAARTVASILTCPAIVQSALEATQTLCSPAGRNQVCYGNILVSAEPQPGMTDFRFERQGDIVSAEAVQTLRLSALDLNQGLWGVSLLRLQANLPDTLPGQNVTFLVFGDVEMVNRVAPPSHGLVPLTATAALSVRTSPTDTSPVIAYLNPGDVAVANGRLLDGSWLRLSEPAGTGTVGWVYAPLVEIEGNIDVVDVVDINGQLVDPSPMQSFYLRTGVGTTGCDSIPSDGVLIQTPHGVGRIDFEVNGVQVNLGSTVFMQAGADILSVSTLEGSAWITANDVTQLAVPGSTVTVPMDANYSPAAPPREAEPYDINVVSRLPVAMLERHVDVQEPMPVERIREIRTHFHPNESVCGSPPLDPCSPTENNGQGNAYGQSNNNGQNNGNSGQHNGQSSDPPGQDNGNANGSADQNQQNNGNQRGHDNERAGGNGRGNGN